MQESAQVLNARLRGKSKYFVSFPVNTHHAEGAAILVPVALD